MNNSFEHIERMRKPFREMQKIQEPILNFQKSLKPVLDYQEKFENLNKIQKTFGNINEIYSKIPQFKNPFLEHLDTFKEIGNRLKYYAENISNHLLLIAQYGWFVEIDCEINFPSKIAIYLNDNRIEEANEKLIEYYYNNIDRIFQELRERHPHRKEIFNQIYSSFQRNDYFTLIPSVLAQVDGVCFDFTKKKFFIKEKNNKYLPQISSELDKSVDSFLTLYLSPLQNQTPIMVQEKDISNFPCKLNRHEILHGISLDYGSKINSLKVISLLKYVSDLLNEIEIKH